MENEGTTTSNGGLVSNSFAYLREGPTHLKKGEGTWLAALSPDIVDTSGRRRFRWLLTHGGFHLVGYDVIGRSSSGQRIPRAISWCCTKACVYSVCTHMC